MSIPELRAEYHSRVCANIIRVNRARDEGGYPNFADGSNRASSNIAWNLLDKLKCSAIFGGISGQTAGDLFESETKDFLEAAFGLLRHLRPGRWMYTTERTAISGFEQYAHLARLAELIDQNSELASALGGDYIVEPDIVIGRFAVSDDEINANEQIINSESSIAQFTPLRLSNRATQQPSLHASISCKWTIRSDRSQNTRTEALNLIRNRKGHIPHIVAVTAEPLPSRLAALALGTGDLDCVYHFALQELTESIAEIENEDQMEMLNMLVQGQRLRDISDLPFDLAI